MRAAVPFDVRLPFASSLSARGTAFAAFARLLVPPCAHLVPVFCSRIVFALLCDSHATDCATVDISWLAN
ncbi:hypothetical protein V9T40_010807 [Parthenolecanium corni]|uniref:Uncharacterized protein n=1 Tax=Parthenolecanium corni TaxID=536013 RepID=A0AAN9TIR3_9HEMI